MAAALVAITTTWAAATTPRSVVLLQIDGLGPELLQAYLGSQDSQAPARAIRRLVGGTSQVPGQAVLLSRAAVGRAVTVLPALSDPASATLLTGAPVRVHGVREAGGTLNSQIPTLFQALARSGGTSAAAGFPWTSGVNYQAPGADDAARVRALRQWLAQRSQPPQLIAVRLDGLAQALARDGTDLGLRALGEVDVELGRLLYGERGLVTATTVVVLTAGHGAAPLQRASAVGKDNLLKLFPAIPAKEFHLAGGLLWLHADQHEAAATLASVERGIAMVLVDTPQGLTYYDREMKRLRRFEAANWPDYPQLQKRVAGFAEPGYVIVVAERKESFEFTGQPQAPKAGFGGPGSAESIVPVVFAGESLAMRQPLGEIQLEDLAPTILSLLGRQPRELGRASGQDLSPRLLSSTAPPTLEPGLTSCREAAELVRFVGLSAAAQAHQQQAVQQACGPLLRETTSRTAAAEATLALAVAAHAAVAESHRALPAAGRSPQEVRPDDLRAALALAAALDPQARWPREDGGLRQWPRAGQRCEQSGGLLVLDATGELGRQSGLLGEHRSWGLASDRFAASAQRCPLAIPQRLLSPSGVEFAAALLRFSGAEVAVYNSGGPSRRVCVVAQTPMLKEWLGPSFISDEVEQPAAMVARGYLHLVRGLHHHQQGLDAQARHHFAAAEALGPEAELWRTVFQDPVDHSPAEHQIPTALGYIRRLPPPTAPAAAENYRWAKVVAQLQDVLGSREPVQQFLSWSWLETYQRNTGSPPPDPEQWQGPRRRLVVAARSLLFAGYGEDRLCTVQNPQARASLLEAVVKELQTLGCFGLAARAQLARVLQLAAARDTKQAADGAEQALALAELPGAEWVQESLAYRLLLLFDEYPSMAAAAPAIVLKVAGRYGQRLRTALEYERLDRLGGYEDRYVNTLLALRNPVFSERRDDSELRVALEEQLRTDSAMQRRVIDKVVQSIWDPVSIVLFATNRHQLARYFVANARLLQAVTAAPTQPTSSRWNRERKIVHALVPLLLGLGDLMVVSTRDLSAPGLREQLKEPLDAMRQKFAEADQLLGSTAELLDARDEELAGKNPVPLLTFAPYLRMVLSAVSLTAAIVLDKDLKKGEAHSQQLLGIVQTFAHRELRRERLEQELGPQLDALVRPATKLIRLAFASGSNDAQALEAARREVWEALGGPEQRDVDCECPPEQKAGAMPSCVLSPRCGLNIARLTVGPASQANAWLRLVEIVAKDAAYVVDLFAQRTAQAQVRFYLPASTKMEELISDWQHELGQTRDFRYHALNALRTVQTLLPELQCLWDASADRSRLALCTQGTLLNASLRKLGQDLAEQFGESQRLVEIADDNFQFLLLDLLIAVLPGSREDIDKYQVTNVLDRAVGRAESLTADAPWRGTPNNRVLLDFILSASAQYLSERRQNQASWAAKGKQHSAGTFFQGRSFIFDLQSYWAQVDADVPLAQAASALQQARSECPALAWQFDLNEANTALARGDLARGYGALDRYLQGVVQNQSGDVAIELAIDTQREHSQVTSKVVLSLARDIKNGVWQAGAGWNTLTANRSTAAWTLQTLNSPAEAAAQAQLLRAWYALIHGDDASAGRAIADVVALSNGLEPGWLLSTPPAGGRQLGARKVLRRPLDALWVATLAELRGHYHLAEVLAFTALEQQKHADAADQNHQDFCSKAEDLQHKQHPLPKDTPWFVTDSQCMVPPFVQRKHAEALRRLVHLHAQRLAHKGVKWAPGKTAEAAWSKELQRVARRDGHLLPAWSGQLARAMQARKPALIPQGAGGAGEIARGELGAQDYLLAAAEHGYACEAVFVAAASSGKAQIRVPPIADKCGNSQTQLLAWNMEAQREPDLDRAYQDLERAIVIAERFTGARDAITFLDPLMIELLNRYSNELPEQYPVVARRLAVRVQALEWANQSVIMLRARAVAHEYLLGLPPAEPPNRILLDANRWSVQTPTTRFLKTLLDSTFNAPVRELDRTQIKLARQFIRGEEM